MTTEALKTKGTARNLYLSDRDLHHLQAVSTAVEMTQVQVLSRIVHAGLEALAAEGNRLPLPLKFHIIEPQPQIMRAEERPAPTLPPKRK